MKVGRAEFGGELLSIWPGELVWGLIFVLLDGDVLGFFETFVCGEVLVGEGVPHQPCLRKANHLDS
jgi:hypothetical protein